MNTIYRDNGDTRMLEKICIYFLSILLVLSCLGVWAMIRSTMEINRLRERIVVLEDQQSYLSTEGMGLVMKVGELEGRVRNLDSDGMGEK
jgi:hypothetical protein